MLNTVGKQLNISNETIKSLKENKVNRTAEAHPFRSSNHHKWLSYQILGSKTVKNVQIDPQTT